mmetsp:Transcript_45309/g.72858  ORF Transcript_45309/g.72858 Transcript_45309/m.72858 type:complete len:688 (+) Transcript_45309:101-2164(+)
MSARITKILRLLWTSDLSPQIREKMVGLCSAFISHNCCCNSNKCDDMEGDPKDQESIHSRKILAKLVLESLAQSPLIVTTSGLSINASSVLKGYVCLISKGGSFAHADTLRQFPIHKPRCIGLSLQENETAEGRGGKGTLSLSSGSRGKKLFKDTLVRTDELWQAVLVACKRSGVNLLLTTRKMDPSLLSMCHQANVRVIDMITRRQTERLSSLFGITFFESIREFIGTADSRVGARGVRKSFNAIDLDGVKRLNGGANLTHVILQFEAEAAAAKKLRARTSEANAKKAACYRSRGGGPRVSSLRSSSPNVCSLVLCAPSEPMVVELERAVRRGFKCLGAWAREATYSRYYPSMLSSSSPQKRPSKRGPAEAPTSTNEVSELDLAGRRSEGEGFSGYNHYAWHVPGGGCTEIQFAAYFCRCIESEGRLDQRRQEPQGQNGDSQQSVPKRPNRQSTGARIVACEALKAAFLRIPKVLLRNNSKPCSSSYISKPVPRRSVHQRNSTSYYAGERNEDAAVYAHKSRSMFYRRKILLSVHSALERVLRQDVAVGLSYPSHSENSSNNISTNDKKSFGDCNANYKRNNHGTTTNRRNLADRSTRPGPSNLLQWEIAAKVALIQPLSIKLAVISQLLNCLVQIMRLSGTLVHVRKSSSSNKAAAQRVVGEAVTVKDKYLDHESSSSDDDSVSH